MTKRKSLKVMRVRTFIAHEHNGDKKHKKHTGEFFGARIYGKMLHFEREGDNLCTG